LSTGVFPGPGDNVGTLPARRPQNLQQAIHTLPQAVDRDVTLSTCPHRFPQDLSTSVGNAVHRCPPLGITPWGWPVDNLGTSNPHGQRAAVSGAVHRLRCDDPPTRPVPRPPRSVGGPAWAVLLGRLVGRIWADLLGQIWSGQSVGRIWSGESRQADLSGGPAPAVAADAPPRRTQSACHADRQPVIFRYASWGTR
jgi:hypothetical protein